MKNQKGSIFVYILGALALMGVLIFSLTGGPQKSATTSQLDALASGLHGDIGALAAAVNDCVLTYTTPVAGNPNTVFPLYDIAGTKGGSAGSGVDIDFTVNNNIVCPGASPSSTANMPVIFGPKNTGSLQILGNTTDYTVNYRNNSTEGVLFRIKRNASDPVWEEAGYRINARYSACKAAWVKDGVTDGGGCTNGCLYFWIVRLPTTAIKVSDDGATCTSP